MSFFKSLGKVVQQVAPIAITGGMAAMTGGSSLAASGIGSAVAGGLLSGQSDGILGKLGSYLGLGTTGANLLGGLVEGAVGLGSDYLTGQQQLQQNKQVAGIELENNLALADRQFQNNIKQQQEAFKQNKQMSQIELRHNRLLADEAYQRDVQMWNLQNKYNSPAAQRARLEAAGMNPNLVYGGGSVTGNTASSAPSYNAPTYRAPSVAPVQYQSPVFKLGMVDAYQKIQTQAIQNNILRQQLWNLKVDTNLKSAMTNSNIQLNKAKKSLTEAVARGHNMDNAGYKRQLNMLLGGLMGLFTEGTGGETAELF